MRSSQKGFTLLELMIVVAVIAILSTIAFPSYQEYVKRSRRIEAQALLSEAAARQERWRAQNGSYLQTGDASEIAVKLKLPYGAQSEHAYYTLAFAFAADGSDGGYTLTASRNSNGPQAADTKCGDFTLDAMGKRGIVASTPGSVEQCWR